TATVTRAILPSCHGGLALFHGPRGLPVWSRILTLWASPQTDKTNAQKRTERASDPDRPRHPDGPAFPQLLAAGAAGGRTAGKRLSAGARQGLVRTAGGVPRFQRQVRPGRRVLRPSRRVALVRP